MKVEFKTLSEALTFVIAHGGPADEIPAYTSIPDYDWPSNGAFGPCYQAVRLTDGAYFIVEAYSNGPLSEITPDEDFGVNLIGVIP